MSDDVFGTNYSAVYDSLYHDKDYEGECNLVERLLGAHGKEGLLRLLDLGCGTGNHTLPLARRGHRVTGIDRSPGMLARARVKAAGLMLPPSTPAPCSWRATCEPPSPVGGSRRC